MFLKSSLPWIKRCDYMTSTAYTWTPSNAGCCDGLGLHSTVSYVDAALTDIIQRAKVSDSPLLYIPA